MKKLLKRFAFVIKSETTKSFTISGEILGCFLPKRFVFTSIFFFWGGVGGVGRRGRGTINGYLVS